MFQVKIAENTGKAFYVSGMIALIVKYWGFGKSPWDVYVMVAVTALYAVWALAIRPRLARR